VIIADRETATRTATRERILDATDLLMQRYGFRKMTMDDIAKEAGLSKRTIYTYFDNKEEVGLSSIDRVVRYAQTRMAEVASGPGSAAKRLQEMLVVRVMARVESVRDYRQSLDELFEAVRPSYMERRKRNFETEVAMIEAVVRAGVEQGRFVVSETAATAELLLRATNAFLPYSLSVAELGDLDAIRKGVEALSDLLIRGLASAPEILKEFSP
jgi:AcrR family transcriptional regulator